MFLEVSFIMCQQFLLSHMSPWEITQVMDQKPKSCVKSSSTHFYFTPWPAHCTLRNIVWTSLNFKAAYISAERQLKCVETSAYTQNIKFFWAQSALAA